jgi:type II secretory pathway component PulK
LIEIDEMKQTRKQRQRIRSRRGTLLIAVLVCLVVVATILLGVVQSSLRQRYQLRNELQLEQTRWLLDAGMGQARMKIFGDADYEGETLTVSPGLQKFSAGRIETEVLDDGDAKATVRVRVTAKLGSVDQALPTMSRSTEFVLKTEDSQK